MLQAMVEVMVFMDMCSLLIMPSVTWYEQSNLVSVSLDLKM